METLLPVVGECECLEERQPGGSNGGHGGHTVLIQSQLTKKNMRREGGDLWESEHVSGWMEGGVGKPREEKRRGGGRKREGGGERVEERGWRSEGGGVRVEELEIDKLSHYLLQVVL